MPASRPPFAVPILPDYLASLDKLSDEGYRNADDSALPPPSAPMSHHMAHRNDEQAQFYMTKHPIPGKSMVNFTLLQLLTTTTMPPAGGRHSDDTNVTASTPTMDTSSSSSSTSTSSSGSSSSSTKVNRNRHFNGLGLTRENGSIGLLLAMKALVQLIFNPIIGNLSSKCGYRLPIMVGTCFLLLSSLGN